MTYAQLIEQVRAGIATRLAQRQTHQAVVDEVRAACSSEQREPTAEENQRMTEARAAAAVLWSEVEAQQARIVEIEAEEREQEAAERLQREVAPSGGPVSRPAYDRVHRVGQEQRTYSPANDPGSDRNPTGGQFLRDLGRQFLFHDPAATERLNRHMQEEFVERGDAIERQLNRDGGQSERAAGTSAFAGLTVPQYLTDFYAPLARAVRPFADAMRSHPLPPAGMTVNISRITTGTSVAVQASENAAVSATDIDDTLLTLNVQTAAGQQTLSRQAIERGTGTEAAMLDDLFRAYGTSIGSTVITQASTGLSAAVQGGNTVSYADATPTAAELWPKLLDAQQRVESALLSVDTDADVAVMHARRWAWLQSQVGPNWPFIAQMNNAGPIVGGANDGAKRYGPGYRGNVAGLNVIVDNNIGTALGAGTEDEIYVVNLNECHLWEDASAPVLIRAEQPAVASLGVLFVVYGYFAYTFGRYPLATSKISGTGLIAPTF